METRSQISHPRSSGNLLGPQVLTESARADVIAAISRDPAFSVAGQVLSGWEMPASATSTELLSISQVEERTHMKRSNIYRLIQLGLFAAPLKLGGSKWIAAEVEEYIQRQKDERDRQLGENKFTPRPAILARQESGALNGTLSNSKPGSAAIRPPSTVRILSPEMVEALRILKIDIPELHLDRDTWNVSLAVIKVEHSPALPAKMSPKVSKTKKR
jgi:predicted DNA-binding transcriptional regulator AlpA